MAVTTIIVTLAAAGAAGASTLLDQQDALAKRAAAAIERLHHNASKALVTAAQDRRFSEYFQTSAHDHREQLKSQIDHISLSVQERFHVEEMCLIDIGGAEISRIVGRKIASDLANRLRVQGRAATPETEQKRPVTDHVDQTRHTAGHPVKLSQCGVLEQCLAGIASHPESLIDVVAGLLRRERTQTMPEHDALP